MRAILVGAASLLLTWGACEAQEVQRRGLPVRNELVGMTSMGGGAQMTPDGRLVLRGWAYADLWSQAVQDGWPRNLWNGVNHPIQPGWSVQVVRPELVTRDANWQPVFTANVFSPPGEGYLVEPGADHGVNNQERNQVIPPSSQWAEHANATYGNAFITASAATPYALPPGRSGAAFPGAVASGVSNKEHTTWYPDPVLDLSPAGELPPTNPYASDANGVPLNGLPAPETAQYVAYEMIAIVFSEYVSRAQEQLTGSWYWHHNRLDNRAKQVPIKVVVQNPYTSNATVLKAWVTGYAANLQWTSVPAGSGGLVRLAEVSVTKDGHFLLGHGRMPMLVSGQNRYDAGVFNFDHVIWATWRTDPADPAGWREPVLLSELYQHRNETLKVVQGNAIPLGDVVRLARQPIRYQNGDHVGNQLVGPGGWLTQRDGSMGAYPWVHWDGDGVLHPIGGARGTIAYCGVQTNWTYASLDAANLSHLFEISGEEHNSPHNPDEHVNAGLMAMTGMWDVYRKTSRAAARAILEADPAHPEEPAFAFVHGEQNPMTLTTMSFEDWTDGEYVAFLRMTPLVKRVDLVTYPPDLQYVWTRHELDQTTDTSGNYHVAALRPPASPMTATVPDTGAAFTVATSNVRPHNAQNHVLPWRRPVFDTNAATLGHVQGRIGEAIRFGRDGYVEITAGPHTPEPGKSMLSTAISAEAFVRVTSAYVGLTRTQDTQLFLRPGVFSVGITPAGAVAATAVDDSGTPVTLVTTVTPFTQPVWRHVAVTFGLGELRCYIDGAPVGVAFSPAGQTSLLMAEPNLFEIGPHGTVTSSSAVLMYVDEFRLSRIVRSAAAIARHAYVETAPAWETNPANLPPLGGSPIRVEDCRVEVGQPWSAAKSAFGSYVFQSPLISLNRNYSCASCHRPSAGFSDGRALAVGHAGATLAFSTPTLADAVTGTAMFWDLRTHSLAAQVTQPIMTPAELGFSTLTTALARLNADGQARSLHRSAFGTSTITDSTLQAGLTAYAQSLIRPNTAVETYEAGTASALTASEKRGRALFLGKARCISCHDGPAYGNGLAISTGAATFGQAGASAHSERTRDIGAFKVPTLRRASDQGSQSTAPYFHDGFASTLAQVVNFYDAGGGQAGTTTVVAGRTSIGIVHLEIVRLALTNAEKSDLIAFLRRLGE